MYLFNNLKKFIPIKVKILKKFFKKKIGKIYKFYLINKYENLITYSLTINLENNLYKNYDSLSKLIKLIKKDGRRIDKNKFFNYLYGFENTYKIIKFKDIKNLIFGLFTFYNLSLKKFAYSYLSSIDNKELIYKYALPEYLYLTATNNVKIFEKKSEEIQNQLIFEKKSWELLFFLIKGYSINPLIDENSKLKKIRTLINKISLSKIKTNNENFSWINYYVNARFNYIKEFYSKRKNKREKFNIGIMDYKTIDLNFCSSNLGDYVQTIVSALAWQRALNINFSENFELGKVLNKVINHNNLVLSRQEFQLNPVPIDRDSNLLFSAYLEKTWFICNGWYRHCPFDKEEKSIFANNIIPIFVSFHLNKTEYLTQDLIDYLKKYQPIGCRDWDTVILLKSNGIESFFSGCLTMTFGDIFSGMPSETKAYKEAFVEVEKDLNSNNYEEFKQVGRNVKATSIENGILDAFEMLKKYREFSKISTSRLHCYLPCTSMNLDVDFIPKNYSDQRFVGLFPINKNEFNKLRNNLRDNLNKIIKYIYLERPTNEEYLKKWKEIWIEQILIAENIFQKINFNDLRIEQLNQNSILEIKNNTFDSKNVSHSDTYIELAFGFDQNLLEQFEVTLNSIIKNTNNALRIYILGRGINNEWKNYIIKKYNFIIFKIFNMENINYGHNPNLINDLTISTMDRLLLPELIDVPKVLYLDTDLIVVKDIKELFEKDISNYYMAAVRSQFLNWENVLDIVVRKSRNLKPNDAKNFRYFSFKYFPNSVRNHFNAGVILLNLDMMRKKDNTNLRFSLVKNYHLNDQDILSLISNGNVLEIDPKFNTNPFRRFVNDPFIIHWAGKIKPWFKNNNFYNQIYKGYKIDFSKNTKNNS